MDTREVVEELRARREQLTTELGVVTTVERDPDASVSFGKRVGDGTTAAVERLNLVGTARELEAMLRDVDRALGKVEDGTYGILRPVREAHLRGSPRSAPMVGPVHRLRGSAELGL